MTNERELLELAAKAAGIELARCRLDDPMWRDFLLSARDPRHDGMAQSWNSLTDLGTDDAHEDMTGITKADMSTMSVPNA